MSTQETRGHVPADHAGQPEGIRPAAIVARDVIAPMGAVVEASVDAEPSDQTPEQVIGLLGAAQVMSVVREHSAASRVLAPDGITPLRPKAPAYVPGNHAY